jgi:hypothetical protein
MFVFCVSLYCEVHETQILYAAQYLNYFFENSFPSAQAWIRAKFKHISKRSEIIETN